MKPPVVEASIVELRSLGIRLIPGVGRPPVQVGKGMGSGFGPGLPRHQGYAERLAECREERQERLMV
jgi:hypothetical protein